MLLLDHRDLLDPGEVSLYDRGFDTPSGCHVEALLRDAIELYTEGLPWPVDLTANLECQGILVEELRLYLEDRIDPENIGFSIH